MNDGASTEVRRGVTVAAAILLQTPGETGYTPVSGRFRLHWTRFAGWGAGRLVRRRVRAGRGGAIPWARGAGAVGCCESDATDDDGASTRKGRFMNAQKL